VTKAVIPAAGTGHPVPARHQGETPKEMLPVVDKPAIQYVVEEAVAAGLDDVLMITGRSKVSIENHFDRAYELEEALAAKGDTERLAQVRESSELATSALRTPGGDPKGLGHAVLLRGTSTSATNRSRCSALSGRHHRQPRPAADPDDRGAQAARLGSVVALM